MKNLQKNIRAISKSRINYCKEKLSITRNVDVVGRVLNKVDGQSKYVCYSVEDDADSGREIDVDEWSNAYISERNGLKMKISRKRKHEEDANENDDERNGTSPLNTPLPKKVNGTSPLNTPLPKKRKHDLI